MPTSHASPTRGPDPAAVLAACPQCHGLVRIPRDRLADRPACPRCKSPVFDGRVTSLDAHGFAAHAERGEVPVLVDFWAPWCGPCRMMAPVLERAAAEWASRIQVAKVNTDEQPGLAVRLGIRSIPTLILFRNGRELARQTGAVDLGTLSRWIERSLGT